MANDSYETDYGYWWITMKYKNWVFLEISFSPCLLHHVFSHNYLCTCILLNFSMDSNYSLLKEIMDTMMKSRECAIDHMKSITDRLNLIGFLGTEINEATQVEIILESLTEEYVGFKEYVCGFSPKYVMKEFQFELLAWRDSLVKDECLYRLHSAGVAISSHYYSPIRQPVENVLPVGEPSVIYISEDARTLLVWQST